MANRVTNGARGGGERSPHSSSARRSDRYGSYHTGSGRAVRAGEERYRPGSRRTAAEPLSASWRPREEEPEPAPKRGKVGKLTKTYGWRVYALPVLAVVTALVVFDTATSPPETPPAEQTSTTLAGGEGSGTNGEGEAAPAGAELPAPQADLNIPTADLPEGKPYAQKGEGTWHVVPGKSEPFGSGGKLWKYTIEIEDGIPPDDIGGEDTFANTVQGILSEDPRGWAGSGQLRLQRVDNSDPTADFKVALTTSDTAKRVCGSSIPYEASCRKGDTKQVVINLARWVRGAKAFSSDLLAYREYAINHEVGHALGHGHIGCGKDGDLAPVMMQQSFGVANDYVAKLNNVPGGDRNSVPADGKVCKPNSYPNPGAQAG
ncbi:DUF3152 domain-containing protein [Amycolatopsis lurida]